MRSRYFFGFAAALGIAGPADAQPFTSRSLPPTSRAVSPAVPGPGRVNYLLPPVSRGPAGQPGVAQPESALPQSQAEVTDDIWVAPGTVRAQPAAALPPPTVTQVRHQEPAAPPAKLPEVA